VSDRPFDAQEILLKEGQSTPSDTWRTVSLVAAMRQMLLRGPSDFAEPAIRRQVFLRAAAVLEGRGVDPRSLTHYGLTREVMGSVVVVLIAPILSRDITDAALLTNKFGNWKKFLGVDQLEIPSDADLHSIVSYIGSIADLTLRRIRRWAYTASMEDLLDLVPSADLDAQVDAGEPPSELVAQYRWIVDRFSVTFIRDWTTSSLHSEFKWARGSVPPPCAPELMAERHVSQAQLTEEIALRAVQPSKQKFHHSPFADQMYFWAKNLLGLGRYTAAAALFEFSATFNTEDPRVYNNSGFCLIPIEAEMALERLIRARDLGYTPRAIVVYNIMCANVALGRVRAALVVADEYWDYSLERTLIEGTIWRHGETWCLADSDDIRVEIADLAAVLANRTGSVRAISVWQSRGESVRKQDS
jgi:hypothetical protein